MGICQSKTEDKVKPNPVNNQAPIPSQPIPSGADTKISTKEMGIDGNIPIPIDVTIKALKSICKITIEQNDGKKCATGFFMKISETKKYLITNYHVISQDKINLNIEIEIHNHKIMKLNFNNRDIKYFPGVKDITMIEIKNNDSIYNDIEFLDYDYSYKKGYYNPYKNAIVFIIQHPLGKKAFASGGKIVNLELILSENISFKVLFKNALLNKTVASHFCF
jgi:hypothetical protein